MDRRLTSWLITTCGLFFLYIGLVQWLGPPKPTEKPADPAPTAQATDTPATDAQANKAPDASGSTVSAGTSTEASSSATETSTKDPAAALISKPTQYLTLGSMDPKDGHELLVTFSSRGAGIARVEAIRQTSPDKFKYQALDNKSAYIGYLAPSLSVNGLQINVVGKGTPAARAKLKSGPDNTKASDGLLPGDVIQKLANTEIRLLSDLSTVLQKLKPGGEVEIVVQRPEVGELTYLCNTIEAPMDLVRLTGESTEEVVGNLSRLSCLTTLASVDGQVIEANGRFIKGLEATLEGVWDSKLVERDGETGVEFTLPLNDLLKSIKVEANLTLVKRFWLHTPASQESDSKTSTGEGYVLDYEVEVINNDAKPHALSIRQEGINGVTLESWWYAPKISPYFFQAAGARDVIYGTPYAGHQLVTCYSIFDAARRNPTAPDRLIFGSTEPADHRSPKYIGVDGYYFSTAFLPHPDSPESLANLYQAGTTLIGEPTKFIKHQEKAANVSFWLDTQTKSIEPNTSHKEQMRIFVGPKQPDLLAKFGLENAIEYGWFAFVAKPLSWLLHMFYAIVRNYGVAIMLLTFLVRGCLFPIGRQAALNAQRMQELAPELKKISEQYKDDYEKRARVTQEFYAKHNFRPWAGCLPVFIQIPIFIGLYRCLSVDIELRQQALLPGITSWCSNLAGPDMLWYWGNIMPAFIAGRGEGWFGPYFNILPCITVVLFIVQQKIMMPKATDEQTQMTQTMMMYMTVFMGLMFFKVPAGLCIYFITSSIWSLLERRLVKRLGPPPKPPVTVAPEPLSRDARREAAAAERKQSSQKPAGFLDKLRQLADQANADNSTTYRRDKPKDKDSKKKK